MTDNAIPSGGHRFSLTAAAAATGTSKRTLLRRIGELESRGAVKDDTGAWSIPIGALFGAGFRVNAPGTGDAGAPAPVAAPVAAPGTAPGGGAPDDLAVVRAELMAVRAELRLAQALACERASHIADLRVALRALPAAAAEPVVAAVAVRRWWWRRR